MQLAPLAFALTLAACAPAVPPPVSGLVEQALELAAQRDLATEPGAGAAGARELVHTDDLSQGAVFERGAHALVLETLERDARTGRFERARTRLQADGPIEAVAARRPWELYVATRAEDGEVVLQRWLVQPTRGARGSGAGAGVEPEAGEAVDADELVEARCARSTVLRTRELDGVRLLACDPDGGYLLALGGDGERLLQVPIQRGAPGYVVLSADRLPALRTACGLFFGRHVQQGCVWAFEACGAAGLDRAVLVDRDEDGSFDEVASLDAGAWSASAFQGSVWTERRFVAAR